MHLQDVPRQDFEIAGLGRGVCFQHHHLGQPVLIAGESTKDPWSSSLIMPRIFPVSFVFSTSVVLRITLLLWGIYQDAHSPIKYTDIDYFVFTDAARSIRNGKSPYDRDTYRYTPLLAWLLLPTTWGGRWFEFGKVLFALGDILAGWLMLVTLRNHRGMSTESALKYAAVWLWNPMVANISTRGSSEGLLGALIMALLWAVLSRRIRLAGVLLGLAVHFKIYPFIYGASIIWWLASNEPIRTAGADAIVEKAVKFVNAERFDLAVASLVTFLGLNLVMINMYARFYVTA